VEACQICEDASQRAKIATLLSDRKRINCPAKLLEQCLDPRGSYGTGRLGRRPASLRFYEGDSVRPTAADVDWVLQRLDLSKAKGDRASLLERGRRVLRGEWLDAALAPKGGQRSVSGKERGAENGDD